MRRKFLRVFAVLVVMFTLAPRGIAQNADVHVSGSTYYVTLASGVAWNQSNGNYIFTPISPNTGVCIFIENQNPTSSHSYTLAAYETGNKSNTNFAGNTTKWVLATLLNPTSSVAANGISASFFNATGAANVAITVTGAVSASGSPDTVNIFATQSNTPTCGATGGAYLMQGAQSPGTAPITNPIYISGQLNSPNQIQPVQLTGSSGDFGLQLGFSGGIGSQISNFRLFGLNGSTNAALATGIFPYCAGGGCPLGDPLGGAPMPTSTGFSGTIPFTASTQNVGQTALITQTVTSSGQPLLFSTANPQAVHRTCQFVLDITGTIAGTSPTLDVYIQDSVDGTVWDDRVHFAQLTGVSSGAFVASVGTGSITPRATTDATLAAGTVADGIPIAPFIRAKFVVGGTSPSFPIKLWGACQ